MWGIAGPTSLLPDGRGSVAEPPFHPTEPRPSGSRLLSDVPQTVDQFSHGDRGHRESNQAMNNEDILDQARKMVLLTFGRCDRAGVQH